MYVYTLLIRTCCTPTFESGHIFKLLEYVIQRRSGTYGSCTSSTCTDELFDTTWEGYKSNFTDAQGESWIGLETLHKLTNIAG